MEPLPLLREDTDPTRRQEIDELIDDWAPEPLVAEPTPLEEAESEKLPVIVGYDVDAIPVAHVLCPLLPPHPDAAGRSVANIACVAARLAPK